LQTAGLSRSERSREDYPTLPRFIHEVKAASALNNAHIGTTFDIVPEDSRELIVMEYGSRYIGIGVASLSLGMQMQRFAFT
jgi:hypothetical protein